MSNISSDGLGLLRHLSNLRELNLAELPNLSDLALQRISNGCRYLQKLSIQAAGKRSPLSEQVTFKFKKNFFFCYRNLEKKKWGENKSERLFYKLIFVCFRAWSPSPNCGIWPFWIWVMFRSSPTPSRSLLRLRCRSWRIWRCVDAIKSETPLSPLFSPMHQIWIIWTFVEICSSIMVLFRYY